MILSFVSMPRILILTLPPHYLVFTMVMEVELYPLTSSLNFFLM